MVVNPHIKFTYQDYCLLPEDRRYELIGGEFFAILSPSVIHQRVAGNLEAALRAYAREEGGGEVRGKGTVPLSASSTLGTGCGNYGSSTRARRR